MNRSGRIVLVELALAACALLAVPAMGQSRTENVLVTNGTTKPVPTTAQGTTNIAGTVTVGNTPSVNVANTPSVSVVNTPSVSLTSGATVGVTSPLDGQGNPTPLAVLDAVQPYEDDCGFGFSGSLDGSCLFQTIPTGKQLVIQEFDASGTLEAGIQPVKGVEFNANLIVHNFSATLNSSANGLDSYVANQETRLYTPAGISPLCSVALTGPSNGNFNCTLSGYLVDVPVGGSSGVVAPSERHQRLPRLNRQPVSPRRQ